MKMHSHKTMAVAVASILLFAMVISLLALPLAKGQGVRASYAYIGASPNPVGIGQEVLLHVGITQQLQSQYMGWEGLIVTLTKPDGKVETLGPFTTDSTGGTGSIYVPSMVGNYTLQTHFPEQVTTSTKRAGGTPIGTVMLASDSDKLTLVVQEEQRVFWPGIPMPAEYWTRPIDAQFREWAPIAGSWLSTPDNLFAPYNDDAPETAHILWAKPFTTGGLAGGGMGEHAMDCGDAYEGKWPSRFVLNGKLYFTAGPYEYPRKTYCIDMHTGEELWAKVLLDNRTISFGQLIYWDSYNYHAVFEYLWVTVGSTWYGFDAFTGELISQYNNVPSGTNIVGDKGEIYRYSINLNQGRMTLWNQSAMVSLMGSWGSANDNRFGSRALNASDNTRYPRAIALNVTLPVRLPGSVRAIKLGDRVVGSSVSTSQVVVWAFSLKKGQEGQLLFNKTWTAPREWAAGNLTVSAGADSIDDGILTVNVKETRQHYGFSTETGEYMWVTEPEHYLDIYNYGRYSYVAYGKMYAVGMSGIINAYDVKTGELLWKYATSDPYSEILWSDNWPMRPVFVTDGKLYLGHEEHSPVDPKPRGAPFMALDVETGEVVWRVDGLFRQTFWGGTAIIGDSIIATQDTYDQRVYAIGKGPSSTTAMIRSDVVTLGSGILIQGMVTDISPGTKDYGLQARFPNGVPAVADESMSAWMLYVYKQFPHAEIIGVPVHVHVLDANGNYRNIGETITDPNGFFSIDWTPDVPGKYSVIVSFAGSKAYYPSYAYTAFYVNEAPPPPAPTPEPLKLPPTDMYIMYATVAIILTIAIVGVLLLRKK